MMMVKKKKKIIMRVIILIIMTINIITMTLRDTIVDYLRSIHCTANCLQYLRSRNNGEMSV